MKCEKYNTFISEIKYALNEFLFNYEIPFNHKFPQNENDDSQYTIDLGEEFGLVNILFESYDNLPETERKNNVYTICMRYHNPKCVKNLFNFDCGRVNEEDGTFILFSSENGLNDLKNDFNEVLKIWSEYQIEKIQFPIGNVSLN